MTLLFKDDFVDERERKQAWQIDTLSEWLVGRQLDIIPVAEAVLSSTRVEDAVCITHLKEGSRLLYGEDIRPHIRRPSHAVYTSSCMYAAFRAVSWHHHHPKPLRFPLNYPDPDDEFYGFNQSMHTVI